MSTTFLNFEKVEVVAESKEKAIEYVEQNLFGYQGDATQAFKNWKEKQTKGITERDIKEFLISYLAKKTKNCPGSGFLITLDPAIQDTRERPYKIEDIPGGKRKYKSVYTWIDEETNTPIVEVDTNKADAKNAIKELFKKGEYKGKAKLVKTKKVIEGQAVVATAVYTPSKNTKNGTWLAFGVKA